ncbi:MAG: M23 family metallopeptidase [Rhodobacteraceae bacterium]|nr:M23 family metallopeptidase [Paracoccaceae bacterium]
MTMTRRQDLSACILLTGLAMLVAGCVDFRSDVTSGRAGATDIDTLQPWPAADQDGIIMIGGRRYAEVLAGETLTDLASRVGEDRFTLSDINHGLNVNRRLSQGTVIRLPAIHQDVPRDAVITEQDDPVTDTEVPDGAYIRHTVRPGETLYTIAEIYSISVRTLAEWNAMQSDFTVRSGMVLVVPIRQPETRTSSAPQGTDPTESQPPPSAPADPPSPAPDPGADEDQSATPAETAPDAAQTADVVPGNPPPAEIVSEAPPPSFAKPMEGRIVDEITSSAGHGGLDIAAPAGADVFAIADGRVALVSGLTEQSTIMLIRHANDIYSVYQHLTDVTLKKDDVVTLGEKIGVLAEKPGFLHFETREGTVGVDPRSYLPPDSYPK